jgi:uncharacterized iron-regulated membrane protein
MTSLGPEVRVWRQVRVAVEPAWRVMTVEVLAVGLGPPLHTMSLVDTSLMGWREVRCGQCLIWDTGSVHRRMRGRGHRLLLRRH